MSDAPKRIWAMTVWGNEWTSGHWDQFDDCDGNVEYVRADELEEARREAWNAAIEAVGRRLDAYAMELSEMADKAAAEDWQFESMMRHRHAAVAFRAGSYARDLAKPEAE